MLSRPKLNDDEASFIPDKRKTSSASQRDKRQSHATRDRLRQRGGNASQESKKLPLTPMKPSIALEWRGAMAIKNGKKENRMLRTKHAWEG